MERDHKNTDRFCVKNVLCIKNRNLEYLPQISSNGIYAGKWVSNLYNHELFKPVFKLTLVIICGGI
jgi:hypothetical protein